MPILFLETSALVKLYVREQGTDEMLQLARAKGNRFAFLALARIEIHSAVRRRERSGEIARRIANHLLELFRQHLPKRFAVQAITENVLDRSSDLIDKYALRAFDALQLAGFIAFCKANPAEHAVFVCADRQLLDAAKQENLEFLNPGTRS